MDEFPTVLVSDTGNRIGPESCRGRLSILTLAHRLCRIISSDELIDWAKICQTSSKPTDTTPSYFVVIRFLIVPVAFLFFHIPVRKWLFKARVT